MCFIDGNMSPACARRRQMRMLDKRGLSVDLDDQEGLSSYNNSSSSVCTSHSNSPRNQRPKRAVRSSTPNIDVCMLYITVSYIMLAQWLLVKSYNSVSVLSLMRK